MNHDILCDTSRPHVDSGDNLMAHRHETSIKAEDGNPEINR